MRRSQSPALAHPYLHRRIATPLGPRIARFLVFGAALCTIIAERAPAAAPETTAADDDFIAKAEQGLAAAREKAEASPQDRELLRELASRYAALGSAYEERGRLSRAQAYFERELKIQRRLAALDPTNADAATAVNHACITLGRICLELNQAPMAIDYFGQWRDAVEAAAVQSHADSLQDQAAVYRTLGDAHWRLSQANEAAGYYRRLAEVRRGLLNQSPSSVVAARDLARALERLATASHALGQPTEAVARLEQSLQLLSSHMDDEAARRELGEYRLRLGDVWLEVNRPERAAVDFAHGLEIVEAFAQARPEDVAAQLDLTRALDGTGRVALLTGKSAEAAAAFERSRAIKRQIAATAPDDPEAIHSLAASHLDLGMAARGAGQNNEALGYFEQALEMLRELAATELMSLPIQHDLVRVHSQLAEMDILRHRYSAARTQLLHGRLAIDALSARLRFNPFEAETTSLDGALRHCDRAEQVIADPRKIPRQPASERARWLQLRVRALAMFAGEPAWELPDDVLARWPARDRPVALLREAIGTTDSLRKEAVGDPAALFDVARCYGVCWQASQRLSANDDAQDAKTLESQTIAALRAAVAAGWNDAATVADAAELAPFRDSAAFQSLLKSLPTAASGANGKAR